MNESAGIPDVNPVNETPKPNLPETEIKPATPVTPERVSPEQTQARLAEVRGSIGNAISSKEPLPPSSPAITPNIEPPRYTLPERFKNVFFNKTNLIMATFTAEAATFIPAYLVAKYLTSSLLVEAAGFPALLGLMWWSAEKIAHSGTSLGKFTHYYPKPALFKKTTPVGSLNFGDVYAELYLSRNMGKMADLNFKQRVFALPTDGLNALKQLTSDIEQKNPKVARIKAFKASSHLVGQYPELFKRIGFAVEERKPNIIDPLAGVLSKSIFALAWGPRQLWQEKSLRGFREALNLKTGKRATAWITPQGLVEHKSQIEKALQRFQKPAERGKR